ncbi:hypothetical protein BU25DRAFT_26730 [Macroventuria anomochaeta]|uniref:Uncharacterized protein n=1 Tax=Macroventuria anomochaeta TaxID=301207 RepID=A0ACB6S4K4_9PLEO|nr:uncharacterized protein BU25DRAFT_26730 [Macroventuria anomochaeta]KAF2629096.1 hypothetical protein BU25DRAFT_26730 [Macroventuria anomochaeta]
MPRAKTPYARAREPLCPSLPPEIWINIFSYCLDLSHLWNTCRRISPTLKACAERAFSENLLGDVHIEFMLDRHNLGGKRGPHEPAISLEFERLGKGDEEGIAWFSGHFRGHKVVDAGMRDKTKAVIMQRWHENVERRKPELPNYTISIGEVVNDTHIPGLVVDAEEYRIRLDWRRMFELFFREQARLEDLRAEWQGSHRSTHQAVATRKAKASKPVSTELPSSWEEIEADARKNIRRTRLKEHYQDNAEMIWAINSLKYFEKADSAKWSSASPQMLPHLPGAGLGERWFGSTNLVQELYLDECSSMNRIDTQMRTVRKQKGG